MTHHTERPDFPMDALTADERRAAAEYAPKPARQATAQPRYNDGDPVAPTLRNFLAMSAAAATVIVVAGVIYLEFAALAH